MYIMYYILYIYSIYIIYIYIYIYYIYMYVYNKHSTNIYMLYMCIIYYIV